MDSIGKILSKIQKELKAPKNQYNKFGKYKYRSCEDIIEAVKPLLPDDVYLIMQDSVKEYAGRSFLTSKVIFGSDNGECYATGCAEIALDQKGMQPAQITGSASSYARKYALNGLFFIDDTKDDDASNEHNKDNKKQKVKKELTPQQKWMKSQLALFSKIESLEKLEVVLTDKSYVEGFEALSDKQQKFMKDKISDIANNLEENSVF